MSLLITTLQRCKLNWKYRPEKMPPAKVSDNRFTQKKLPYNRSNQTNNSFKHNYVIIPYNNLLIFLVSLYITSKY